MIRCKTVSRYKILVVGHYGVGAANLARHVEAWTVWAVSGNRLYIKPAPCQGFARIDYALYSLYDNQFEICAAP